MADENSFVMFQQFLGPMRKIARTIGTDIFDPNFQFNIRTGTLALNIMVVIVSYIFMVFKNSPFPALLEGTTITIISIQGMHKLYVGVGDRLSLRSCFDTIFAIHENYQNEERCQVKLKLCISHCMKTFKTLIVLYSSVLFCYTLLPVFLYYYTGIVTTVIPVHFPFINETRTAGYLLNVIHQICFLSFGCVGVVFADMTLFMFILHSITFVALIQLQFEDLNDMIISRESSRKSINDKFVECVIFHQNYISYVTKVRETYSSNCLVQVVTSEALLTLSLFLILWNKWIVGPFLVVAALFQLLGYCVLGTVIQVQNEIVCNIFYNCSWYLMPVKLQKNMVFLLIKAQQSPELEVGKYAKLNVETCMAVLKATYSYLMMILEFIK